MGNEVMVSNEELRQMVRDRLAQEGLEVSEEVVTGVLDYGLTDTPYVKIRTSVLREYIVKYREEGVTLAEIGRHLGLSRQRVDILRRERTRTGRKYLKQLAQCKELALEGMDMNEISRLTGIPYSMVRLHLKEMETVDA